jgi:hypothetical protein
VRASPDACRGFRCSRPGRSHQGPSGRRREGENRAYCSAPWESSTTAALVTTLAALTAGTGLAATGSARAAAPAPADASHQALVNKADGGRLATFSDWTSDGTGLVTNRSASFAERRMVVRSFTRQPDGSYELRNDRAGTCAQPRDGKLTEGNAVEIRPCDGSYAQRWTVCTEAGHDAAAGWFSLRPASDPRLALTSHNVGGDWANVELNRAENGSDRLRHAEDEGASW